MITAIEAARHVQRQRAKSAASGSLFSVPAMPGMANLLPSSPQVSAGSVCLPSASAAPVPAASTDLGALIGRSIGTGQCVALVRAAQPSLGPASTWTAGAHVQGNTSLQPGTPIATFDPSSRYTNSTDGSSHAAIYLGQDATGVQVLDQWMGSAASVRTIPWDNPGAASANTGTAFRVVRPAEA